MSNLIIPNKINKNCKALWKVGKKKKKMKKCLKFKNKLLKKTMHFFIIFKNFVVRKEKVAN